MKTFLKNLQFIFRPKFWSSAWPYDKDWDDELNILLDEHRFTYINDYTAKLGGTEIWVANYPYASFWKRTNESNYKLPSKLTILRVKEQLERDLLRQKYNVQYNTVVDRYRNGDNYTITNLSQIGKLSPRGKILKHRFSKKLR